MLSISTDNPQDLLDSIRAAIKAGHVKTWSCDNDGDFTHSVNQWTNTAWLRPIIKPGALEFGLIPTSNGSVSVEVYAIYHGRFIEMLLSHFDKKFSSAKASALGTRPQDTFV